MQDDLLLANNRGDAAFVKFVKERLISYQLGFHASLKKLKLKTFSSQTKEDMMHCKRP